MVRRDDNLDWDELLNGKLHTVNLAATGFAGGINDLRALAYREADRRRMVVVTHKRNPYTLTIQAKLVCTCDNDGSRAHNPSCPFHVAAPTAEQQARAQANATLAEELQRAAEAAQDEAMRQLEDPDPAPGGLAA